LLIVQKLQYDHEYCNTNTIAQNCNPLIQAIESGTAVAVSDGSYLDTQNAGMAGWIIEDTSHMHQAAGTTECPGSSEVQCSHRSELTGLLGIISHVNRICQLYNVQQGAITIGCNGQGALQTVHSHSKCTSSHKHFDFILSIQASIAHSNIKWNFCHIEGHQDDVMNYDELN
jgi:hypothetical protein